MKHGSIATNIYNLVIEVSAVVYEHWLHNATQNPDSWLQKPVTVNPAHRHHSNPTKQVVSYPNPIQQSKPRTPPPFETPLLHFAFLSRHSEGMICYMDGNYSKHVHKKMRIGKYLRKYYPHYGDDKIRELSNLAQSKTDRFTFELITDPSACLDVYRECDEYESLRACMTKSASDYNSPRHPMMTLFNHPDIGVVIIRDSRHYDNPVARAVVDHQRQVYPMVYGRWELARDLLATHGYEHDDFSGLKLDVEVIDYDEIIMPYIDAKRDLDRSHHSAMSFDYDPCTDDTKVMLCRSGEYEADSTEGLVTVSGGVTCDECGDRACDDDTHYIDSEDQYICSNCADRHFTDAITDGHGNTVLVRDNEVVRAADGTAFADIETAYENDYATDIHGDLYPNDELSYDELTGESIHDSNIDDYYRLDTEDGMALVARSDQPRFSLRAEVYRTLDSIYLDIDYATLHINSPATRRPSLLDLLKKYDTAEKFSEVASEGLNGAFDDSSDLLDFLVEHYTTIHNVVAPPCPVEVTIAESMAGTADFKGPW